MHRPLPCAFAWLVAAAFGLAWAPPATACDVRSAEVGGNGVDEDCDGADSVRAVLTEGFTDWPTSVAPEWDLEGDVIFDGDRVRLGGGDAIAWRGAATFRTGELWVAVEATRSGAAPCTLGLTWHDAAAPSRSWVADAEILSGTRSYVFATGARAAGPRVIDAIDLSCPTGGVVTVDWLVVQNGPRASTPKGEVDVRSARASTSTAASMPVTRTEAAAALPPEPVRPGPTVAAGTTDDPPTSESTEPTTSESPTEDPPTSDPGVAEPEPTLDAATLEPPVSYEEAPAPADPGAPVDQAGRVGTYATAECRECHTTTWVSGHVAPRLLYCETCHTPVDPAAALAKGEHRKLQPASDATCTSCHERSYAGRTHPHTTAMGKGCTSCHDPHDGGLKPSHLRTKTAGQLCLGCHTDYADNRSVHTAVKRGMCTSCHDPHGSSNAAMLRSEDPNAACATCHVPVTLERKVPHLPAATGRCDACHVPHASANDFQLRLPAAQTCGQCHTPKDTGSQVHSAVVLGRCAKCHDPHGSDNPRKLRGDPVAEVCFRCHADDIKGRKVVHAPVAAGLCTICHDPHTTDNPKNLRSNVYTTCTMCHPDKDRRTVKTQHMAVIAYGCTQCHDPHASDNEFRLRKPIVKLCTSCHRGYDDGLHVIQFPAGGGHPIGGRPDPLRDGRELVCTSCHDPHGTENPRMWYRATEKLALCMECHRKTLAPQSKVGESTYEKEAAERQRQAPPSPTPAPEPRR